VADYYAAGSLSLALYDAVTRRDPAVLGDAELEVEQVSPFKGVAR
jgi:hypothetical protein